MSAADPGAARPGAGGSSAAEPSAAEPSRRLVESWTVNAAAWTDAVREGRIESRRVGTDAALVDLLVSRGPGRLLDVGCGEGWLARALAPHGFDVVGVDGSRPLIDAARDLGGGEFHVLAYEAIVEHDDAVPGPFDVIVCNFSLLAEDVGGLLCSLADRLGPRGALVVQTVHPVTAVEEGGYRDQWREERFAGFGAGFRAPMPWFYRTLGSWVRALSTAGLVVTDCVEPPDPRNGARGGRPLSLILVARPAGDARSAAGVAT